MIFTYLLWCIWANLPGWKQGTTQNDDINENEEAEGEQTDESGETFTYGSPLSMLLETITMIKFFYNILKGL